MRIVADTNTFLAVAMDEPEKPLLVQATKGHDLVAPAVLPYEIGNALSALVRRKRVTVSELPDLWASVGAVPVELASIDVRAASVLAGKLGIYAYDAYFLQCAWEAHVPLLTLDSGMRHAAGELRIPLVELP